MIPNPSILKATKSNFSLAYKRSNGDSSSTYRAVIDFYESLAVKDDRVGMKSISKTENVEPLHLLSFKPENVHENPLKVLISNTESIGGSKSV
jgi:hypothetical protein